MRRLAIGLSAGFLALALAGCAGGDGSRDTARADGADLESAEVGLEPTLAPPLAADLAHAYGIASLCDLVGVADVEVAADGLGWGVVGEGPAECVYQDPDATHTVTLTLTSLSAFDELEAAQIAAGASGMKVIASDESSHVWAPAGADAAIVVTQRPPVLSDAAMVSLAEEAALAFENLP